jgi:hypothetical protein
MRGGMSPSWTRTGQNQEYPGDRIRLVMQDVADVVDPPKNESGSTVRLPVAILSEITYCGSHMRGAVNGTARPGTRGRQVCPASAPLHFSPCSSLYLYHSSSICRRPWLCRCLCRQLNATDALRSDIGAVKGADTITFTPTHS